MSLRPKRPRIENEIGQPKSLPSGAAAFKKSGSGPQVIFFGLGPEPGKLPGYFPEVKTARFIECPDFERQMDPGWAASIPAGYSRMQPDELTPEMIRKGTVLRYEENSRLFPCFWGPLNASRALPHAASLPPTDHRVVWLPGNESDLLGRELEAAFRMEGFQPERVEPERDERPEITPWQIAQQRPKLFFSVNFKGLDPGGGYYHLLRHAGTRVAVWCVDNPFHLLAGIKSNYWKDLDLFVTDAWFIEPLKKLGAKSVHHLPLAASPGLFKSCCEKGRFDDLDGRLVFVGRSEFPGKRGFFSGVRLPEALWARAREQLPKGHRPGFGWWFKELGVSRPWPGKDVRRAGLGAEETGLAWRSLCLEKAGERLTIFGDKGWRELLPQVTDIRGPVDYYTDLPAVYRKAACVLNMTSPLLPHGLTQRHFDVWAAGGFLITDNTPGLSIFPEELVREVSFSKPAEIEPLFERYAVTGAGGAVAAAWREVILAEHTYRHRVRAVLAAMGL